MEGKKQFISYWRHIVNINSNIIRLTNKNQWHIFDQSWHFTQKYVTLCDFLQKKQVKLSRTTFARSILYLKSSSQWILLRKDILS